MYKAGEKHKHTTEWGEEMEQFHTVETTEGEKFRLLQFVKVTKKSGETVEGQIIYIDEDSFEIVPQHTPMETIYFEEIEYIGDVDDNYKH